MADHSFEGKVSMINRMATFIKATTEELAEVNAKLEEANRRLSELAITDALTGIGNKAAYIDRVRELDARIAEGDAAFSVAVFDLNGLKAINDSRGHECGDIAITDTAHLLCDVFGRGNLYRIGGDEFIAVLPETAPEAMRALFDRLDDAIVAKNRTPGPYGAPLALSRGWATVRPGEDTAYHAVFKRADDAMYRDKAEYYKTHDRRKR